MIRPSADAMDLAPYDAPRIREYRGRDFREATLRWRRKIDALLFKNGRFWKGLQDPWVRYAPNSAKPLQAAQPGPWVLKLYVCVSAGHYWPLVATLIARSDRLKTPWKFFVSPRNNERPDKIVFYVRGPAHARRLIRQLRPLLRGKTFHPLRHAARSSEVGLERDRAGGIFVGTDPAFLNGESWRLYRSHCMAWAGLNLEYLESLPGGAARWLERMNLAREHEGPASLTPKPDNIPYIRRYWRTIDWVRKADQ